MTNQSDIQQARDVLAKWREHVTEGNWAAGDEQHSDLIWFPQHPGYHPALAAVEQGDMHLIVGTAGNPDLLDAIDAMLAVWADWSRLAYLYVPDYIETIAAAIVAADERMSA